MAEITLSIDWAELDLYGHVNNVAYFRYIQAARVTFCESVGLTALKEPGRLSFILASSHCDYRKKLYYPGHIQVQSQVVSTHNTSFHLEHSIFNHHGDLCAVGLDVIVLYDYEKDHKVMISDEFRKTLSGSDI